MAEVQETVLGVEEAYVRMQRWKEKNEEEMQTEAKLKKKEAALRRRIASARSENETLKNVHLKLHSQTQELQGKSRGLVEDAVLVLKAVQQLRSEVKELEEDTTFAAAEAQRLEKEMEIESAAAKSVMTIRDKLKQQIKQQTKAKAELKKKVHESRQKAKQRAGRVEEKKIANSYLQNNISLYFDPPV